MDRIQKQAELAAARVDSQAVQLDPFTIITIFGSVLPQILSCWNRMNTNQHETTSERVRKFHDESPNQLRKKTARRIRGEADQPMEKWQSLLLADAVIAQAIAEDPQEVALCCAEAPEGL